MRKVLISVLMMIALVTISAVGKEGAAFGEDTLVIKGYKIGKMGEGVSLTITNAVTEMLGESGEHDTGPLDIAGDGDRINLSPIVGSLLGGSSGAGIFREQVIFSYRVVGYEPMNLTLSMEFSPLVNTDTTVIEDNSITVSLEEGSVELLEPSTEEGTFLKPGEMADYNRETGDMDIREGGGNMNSWVTDDLDIQNTSLAEIAEILSHHFNIDIHVEKSIGEKYRYTFQSHGESLKDLLDILTSINPIQYKYEDEHTVLITPK